MAPSVGITLTSTEARRIAVAVRRFHDEVFCCADDIDPNQEMDWADMAFGFLTGCGVPARIVQNHWLDLMQAGDVEDLITDLENIR